MERQSDCSFPAAPQSHPFGARNVARKRSGLGTTPTPATSNNDPVTRKSGIEIAAITAYTQNFSSGAHVAEARQRLAALDEQARKEADEKAWADAEKAGTAAAFTSYVQKFGSGAHVAEARQRAAALETQGRKQVPTIDIQKTCEVVAFRLV